MAVPNKNFLVSALFSNMREKEIVGNIYNDGITHIHENSGKLSEFAIKFNCETVLFNV